MEPYIPGTPPGDCANVRYISFGLDDEPCREFAKVVCKIEPTIANGGGVVLEHCVITTPDGTMFFPLSYHVDVEGWRRQIEGGARELGLSSTRIDGDNFVVADGHSYPLSACKVEFKLPARPTKRPARLSSSWDAIETASSVILTTYLFGKH
jgi:hypothetical protein